MPVGCCFDHGLKGLVLLKPEALMMNLSETI